MIKCLCHCQPDMKMFRLVRAPTGRDALGSTTSRRSLRRSSCKTSTSTLKTRPRLPTEAISPMSPMRRCRSWVCPFLPILYFNHEIDCICLFSQGALWQLLWGCLRWVRGQIWTGSENHQKCWQKCILLGWGDERVRQLGWSSGNWEDKYWDNFKTTLKTGGERVREVQEGGGRREGGQRPQQPMVWRKVCCQLPHFKHKNSKSRNAFYLIFQPGPSMPSSPRWLTSAKLAADSETLLLSSLIDYQFTPLLSINHTRLLIFHTHLSI